MLQQTHDSGCHCFDCKILKPNRQFICPILLVQFNRHCERGGDNDEGLHGEGTFKRFILNLFFPKMSTEILYFFFLALRAPSRALASLASSPMFLKRTKRKIIKNNVCVQATSASVYFTACFLFCDDQLVYFPVCAIVVKDCRKLNNFKKENNITDLLKQKQKKKHQRNQLVSQ